MTKKYLKQLGCAALLAVFAVLFFKLSYLHKGKVLSATTTITKPSLINSSSTVDSITSQVQDLIQENTDLTNQLAQAQLAASVHRTLKRGAAGEDVMAVQKMLQQALGDKNISVSGFYGKATEKAVKAFQTQEKLPVTGLLDAETLTILTTVISDQAQTDTSSYDNLLQQLSDACSMPDNSLAADATSSDTSTTTLPNNIPPASNVCPVGCIAQDQIPDCSADNSSPDSSVTTITPSPSPSPTPPSVTTNLSSTTKPTLKSPSVTATSTPKTAPAPIATSTKPILTSPSLTPTSTPKTTKPIATSTNTTTHR